MKKTVELLVRDHVMLLHTETLIHVEQESHYTSHAFMDVVNDSNLRKSMSRRGNCRDNAPQESFFGDQEDNVLPRIERTTDFREIQVAVDEYYNNKRYQWDLVKLVPNEYYQFVNTGVYPRAINEIY